MASNQISMKLTNAEKPVEKLSKLDDRIADEVLSFWFDQDIACGYCEYRPVWFEQIDPAIRDRFSDIFQRAINRELEFPADHASGALALALILILDHISRNLFRSEPVRYAQDETAFEIARQSVARHDDRELPPLQRCFMYMPFQHSENADHQSRSVVSFETLGSEAIFQRITASARDHLHIIENFWPFPNRNDVLNRQSSAGELAFLASATCIHLTSA